MRDVGCGMRVKLEEGGGMRGIFLMADWSGCGVVRGGRQARRVESG